MISYLTNTKPFTDIKIICCKDTIPEDYTVLDIAVDGSKVQLWEGRSLISVSKRFLCYSRKIMPFGLINGEDCVEIENNPPLDQQMVIVDIKILQQGEPPKQGYTIIDKTYDYDLPALKKHILAIKMMKRIEVKQAVTNLIFVNASHLRSLPAKFSILPSINGYSLCYQISPIDNAATTNDLKGVEQQLTELQMQNQIANNNPNQTASATAEAASYGGVIDKLSFKMNDILLSSKTLEDSRNTSKNLWPGISKSDLNSNYIFDFTLAHTILDKEK